MGSNPFAAKKGLPEVIVASDKSEHKAPEAPPVSEVPAGSINEVLAWVDGDKDRAKIALKEEKAGAGRKTLVKGLEEILHG